MRLYCTWSGSACIWVSRGTYIVGLYKLRRSRQEIRGGRHVDIALDRSTAAAIELDQLAARATHKGDKMQVDLRVRLWRSRLSFAGGLCVRVAQRIAGLQELGALPLRRIARGLEELREWRAGLHSRGGPRIADGVQQADGAACIADLGQLRNVPSGGGKAALLRPSARRTPRPRPSGAHRCRASGGRGRAPRRPAGEPSPAGQHPGQRYRGTHASAYRVQASHSIL